MVNKYSFIRFSLVLISLVITMPHAHAVKEDPCSQFKNAAIDQSLISQMLDAAEDGYLYRVKTDSSTMGFCVKSPIGLVSGSFKKFQGGIALKEPHNQTLISVDMSSVNTDTLFIKELLQGDDFFDIEDHPALMFVSSGFEWQSDTKAVIKGELSMHGVTKPVAFYVEITEVDQDLGDSDTILVKATTTIQRSEFGMRALSPLVSDKVNLCMSVKAERVKA